MGQVVGSSYTDATRFHAFMTNEGGAGIRDLMPGIPLANGVVVGSSFTAAMQQHVFVDGLAGYTGPIDLNSLAALADDAYFTGKRHQRCSPDCGQCQQ